MANSQNHHSKRTVPNSALPAEIVCEIKQEPEDGDNFLVEIENPNLEFIKMENLPLTAESNSDTEGQFRDDVQSGATSSNFQSDGLCFTIEHIAEEDSQEPRQTDGEKMNVDEDESQDETNSTRQQRKSTLQTRCSLVQPKKIVTLHHVPNFSGHTPQSKAVCRSPSMRISKQQQRRLLCLIEKYPDIANGHLARNMSWFWKEAAIELNSLGPPMKEATEWKKVWVDMKHVAKKKHLRNKREQMAARGGPYKMCRLNAIEEKILLLTNFTIIPKGKKTKSVGREIPVETAHETANVSEPRVEHHEAFEYQDIEAASAEEYDEIKQPEDAVKTDEEISPEAPFERCRTENMMFEALYNQNSQILNCMNQFIGLFRIFVEDNKRYHEEMLKRNSK
uniref:Regulatory protein zeste n=1 Tax=Anopheles dirus TaxID=7168 RepID=A0A182NWQ8_9DIPT